MNIIYLLTNKTKSSGRRFYIGSKSECTVVPVDGVMTMIDRKGLPYYSSSCSIEFWEDFKRGDVFEASILEEVYDRYDLIATEDAHIVKNDAVISDEYYNISNAFLNTRNVNAIVNLYGEDLVSYAKSRSNTSKKDNTAKDLGFKNFGELVFDIHKNYKILQNWARVSELYGKERHWSNVYASSYNIDKAHTDLEKCSENDVRSLYAKKCSLSKICEILCIEPPAARVLLGDFADKKTKQFNVAYLLGMSQGELEAKITIDVLNDVPIKDICTRYGVNETSMKRYFMRCIRRHLSPEDISPIIHETEEEIAEARKARKIKQARLSMTTLKSRVAHLNTPEPVQSNNKSGYRCIAIRVLSGGGISYSVGIRDGNSKTTLTFNSDKYGSQELALEAAIKYRDEQFAILDARRANVNAPLS